MLLRNGKLIIWKIENNIVCFNDTVLPATCGVPRGSILRPTLLLLYVYDNYVQVSTFLYLSYSLTYLSEISLHLTT